MPTIRNTSSRDLWALGVTFGAGQSVDVSDDMAETLCTNPNFEPVEQTADDQERPKAGKKGDR